MEALTLGQLKELLYYDPDTGDFFWRQSRGSVKSGSRAGRLNNGYIGIQINQKKYAAHRLAIFYMCGAMPSELVDHINLVTTDNRFSNLRLASKSQNNCHKSKPKNNQSGYKGVSWDAGKKKWLSRVTHNRKVFCLGYYDEAEDAYKAYMTKAIELHGRFFHP